MMHHGFSLIDVLLALGILLFTVGTAASLQQKAQDSNQRCNQQTAFGNIFQHTLTLPPERLDRAGNLSFDRFGLLLEDHASQPPFLLSWEPAETDGIPAVTFRLQYPNTGGQCASLSWTRRWRQHASL